MYRIYALILLALTFALCSVAQNTDTISQHEPWLPSFAQSSIGQASMVSVPLALGSIAVRSEDSHFIDATHGYLPTCDKREYYLQYAPAVTLLSMKIAGVEGTSTWSQMLTADAFSVALMGGAVECFKHTFDAERPDGTDHHAFPSGHTATAFMTATMLHHEYGARYPWLSVLGYGTATATGIMRISQNRHSVSDVMAGASVGIMATELGYLFSDLIFYKSILYDVDCLRGCDNFKPSFIGYNALINVPLGEFKVYDDLTLKLSSGYTIGVEGAWFINKNIGIGVQGAYADMRVYANGVAQCETLNYYKGNAGLYASLPTSRFFSIGIKATAGYARYGKIETTIATDDYRYIIPSRGGMAYGCGLWLMMRAQQRLSYKIFCDYDLLPGMVSEADRLKTLGIGLQMALTF